MSEVPVIEGGKSIIGRRIEAWAPIDDDDIKAVVEVLKSGRLSQLVGTKVQEFENFFARYHGVKHCIAVSNGSVALYIALKALGVGPGDEVLVPAFTFVSTATCVVYANAVPVFVDVSRETFNMDPCDLEDKLRKHRDRAKAVIVVHLCGHPAEMDDIVKICREYGVYLIEDCAQAVGAEYRGRKVGTFGDLGCFSFYQTKNLTTGEGGAIITNNDELAKLCKMIRCHGEETRYEHVMLGFNFRMTELQAALGISQLRKLDRLNERRREIAKVYTEALSKSDLLILPSEKPYVKHVWHIYNVLLHVEKMRVSRDYFVKALKAEGAIVSVCYPKPIYRQLLFQELRGHGKGCPWSCPYYGKTISYKDIKCPNTEWICERVFTLYTFPTLSNEDAELMAKAVLKLLNYYRK